VTKLQLLGSSAKHKQLLQDTNFDCLVFRPHATTANDMLAPDVKSDLRPALDKLKQLLIQKLQRLKEQQLEMKEKADVLEDLMHEKKDNILLLEAQLNKMDATYNMEKQTATEALRQKAVEMENMHQDAQRRKVEKLAELEQSKAAIDKTLGELEQLEKDLNKGKEAFGEYIYETLDALMEHKSSISQILENFHKEQKEELGRIERAARDQELLAGSHKI